MTQSKDKYTIKEPIWPGLAKRYGYYTTCIGISEKHWNWKLSIGYKLASGKKAFPGSFLTPAGRLFSDYPHCALWKHELVAIVPIRELTRTGKYKKEEVKEPKVAKVLSKEERRWLV